MSVVLERARAISVLEDAHSTSERRAWAFDYLQHLADQALADLTYWTDRRRDFKRTWEKQS
jgi:hypothetical protein